jgi:pimeloyl-ACP methyl ester carboxylesterase
VTATQVALNLTIDYPDKIGKVIILGGSPYRYYASQKDGQWNDWEHEMKFTPEKREKLIEAYWAPQWFKTVTKETWDANMWMPADYCKDNIIGEKLFDESAAVSLPVMIRYLLEYMAYDASMHYREISVPVLVMIPDFDGWLYTTDGSVGKTVINPALLYLKYFHQVVWQPAMDSQNHFLKFETVPGTRLFMWYDNPAEVYRHINAFLADKN